MTLDIMFKDDATINKFRQSINEVIQYGRDNDVRVNIFTDPVRKASTQ